MLILRKISLYYMYTMTLSDPGEKKVHFHNVQRRIFFSISSTKPVHENRALQVYYGSALFFTWGGYGGLLSRFSVLSLSCHFDIFIKVLMIAHIHIQRALSSFKVTVLAPNQWKDVRVKVNNVSIFLCQTIEISWRKLTSKQQTPV